MVWDLFTCLGEHLSVGPALIKPRDSHIGVFLILFQHFRKAAYAIFCGSINRLPGLGHNAGF